MKQNAIRKIVVSAGNSQRLFIGVAALNIVALLVWSISLWFPNLLTPQPAQPLRIVLREITNSKWGPTLVFELRNASRSEIQISSLALLVEGKPVAFGLPKDEPGARPVFYGFIDLSRTATRARQPLDPGAGYIMAIHAPDLRRYTSPAYFEVTTVRVTSLIEDWRSRAARWLRGKGYQGAAKHVRPERPVFIESIHGPISAASAPGTELLLKEKRERR